MSNPIMSGLSRFTRNRAGVVAVVTASVVLGAAGFAAAGPGGSGPSDSSGPSTSAGSSSSTSPSSSTDPSTSAPSTSSPASTEPSTSAPASTDPATTAPAPSTDPATTAPAPSTDPATTAPAPSTAPATTAPATTVDDDDAVEPFTKTYSAAGGSITVTWDGERMTLDSVDPAEGFVAEVEKNEGDRIRVDFESEEGNSGSGNNESRIEVRVHNGELREEIEG